MKKNGLFAGMLVLALVFGMVLTGCDTGTGGGGGGTLTISNSPGSGSVYICDSSAPTTQMGLAGLLSGSIASGMASDRSTYPLQSSTGGTFSGTGSYLVIFTQGGASYFKGDVSFNNGSATVDYNSMTAASTLPIGGF
jgi:hypothetical protein